jgi:hypothetical protein
MTLKQLDRLRRLLDHQLQAWLQACRAVQNKRKGR